MDLLVFCQQKSFQMAAIVTLKCRLRVVSIMTSLKFGRLVKGQRTKRDYELVS